MQTLLILSFVSLLVFTVLPYSSALACYTCNYDAIRHHAGDRLSCTRDIPLFKSIATCENREGMTPHCHNQTKHGKERLLEAFRGCGYSFGENTHLSCDAREESGNHVTECSCNVDGCNVVLNLYLEQLRDPDHRSQKEKDDLSTYADDYFGSGGFIKGNFIMVVMAMTLATAVAMAFR